MKIVARSSILIVMLPLSVSAATAWESYVEAPTPARAERVRVADYANPTDSADRLDADLNVLADEVAAGDAEAIRLNVRLIHQFTLAAATAEYLEAVLGTAVRPNPAAFLSAISTE